MVGESDFGFSKNFNETLSILKYILTTVDSRGIKVPDSSSLDCGIDEAVRDEVASIFLGIESYVNETLKPENFKHEYGYCNAGVMLKMCEFDEDSYEFGKVSVSIHIDYDFSNKSASVGVIEVIRDLDVTVIKEALGFEYEYKVLDELL